MFFSASLQGVHAPTTRRSSLLRSPSHTGQTSGSQLPPASSASASSAPSSPAAVAPGSAAGVSVSVPRQHVAAAPRILVNFGALPFLSAAPASAAYDHQQPPDLARVAEEAARVTDSFVVALASSHAGARKPGAEDGAEAEAAATAAESAPVTVRFEERAAERVPELPSDRAGYTRLLVSLLLVPAFSFCVAESYCSCRESHTAGPTSLRTAYVSSSASSLSSAPVSASAHCVRPACSQRGAQFESSSDAAAADGCVQSSLRRCCAFNAPTDDGANASAPSTCCLPCWCSASSEAFAVAASTACAESSASILSRRMRRPPRSKPLSGGRSRVEQLARMPCCSRSRSNTFTM